MYLMRVRVRVQRYCMSRASYDNAKILHRRSLVNNVLLNHKCLLYSSIVPRLIGQRLTEYSGTNKENTNNTSKPDDNSNLVKARNLKTGKTLLKFERTLYDKSYSRKPNSDPNSAAKSIIRKKNLLLFGTPLELQECVLKKLRDRLANISLKITAADGSDGDECVENCRIGEDSMSNMSSKGNYTMTNAEGLANISHNLDKGSVSKPADNRNDSIIMSGNKISDLNKQRSDIENFFNKYNEKTFPRVFNALYRNISTVDSLDEIKCLPKPILKIVSEIYTLGTLTLVDEKTSKKDGTVKRAYALNDGGIVESVLMRYDDGRNTVCVSSQSGCAMKCSFCATGHMGLNRNLSYAEIVEQVLNFNKFLILSQSNKNNKSTSRKMADKVTNVVYMGMGEPMSNYSNVIKSCYRLADQNHGLGIRARNITISTVGIVPKINRYIREMHPFKFSISLHTPFDKDRSTIMPINKKYNILNLMDAAYTYVEQTHRVTLKRSNISESVEDNGADPDLKPRLYHHQQLGLVNNNTTTVPMPLAKKSHKALTFQYCLIEGVNNSVKHIAEIGKLLHPIKKYCHVNVIPLNPTPEYKDGRQPNTRSTDAFIQQLKTRGIHASTRLRRGIDIEAGCGQLAQSLTK